MSAAASAAPSLPLPFPVPPGGRRAGLVSWAATVVVPAGAKVEDERVNDEYVVYVRGCRDAPKGGDIFIRCPVVRLRRLHGPAPADLSAAREIWQGDRTFHEGPGVDVDEGVLPAVDVESVAPGGVFYAVHRVRERVGFRVPGGVRHGFSSVTRIAAIAPLDDTSSLACTADVTDWGLETTRDVCLSLRPR